MRTATDFESKTETRQAVDALGEAAHKMREGVREAGHAAKEKLSQHADGARADIRSSADHAQAAVNGLTDGARSYIVEHPGKTLAAAFFGGILLAVLLRR
jgi:ElaB/YqjD/DUF883 family membrane-anchored ribosome-binding protein